MESNNKPGFAPAGAPMNNKSANSSRKDEKDGIGTAAKAGLGAVAGAAAAFGASAAVNNFGEDVIIEGGEGILDGANSVIESFTGVRMAPEAEEAEITELTEETGEENGEVVDDPNSVLLDPDADIHPDNGGDDFVFESTTDTGDIFDIDEPVAMDTPSVEEIDPFVDDTPETLYSFDDTETGVDPIDDIML